MEETGKRILKSEFVAYRQQHPQCQVSSFFFFFVGTRCVLLKIEQILIEHYPFDWRSCNASYLTLSLISGEQDVLGRGIALSFRSFLVGNAPREVYPNEFPSTSSLLAVTNAPCLAE